MLLTSSSALTETVRKLMMESTMTKIKNKAEFRLKMSNKMVLRLEFEEQDKVAVICAKQHAGVVILTC